MIQYAWLLPLLPLLAFAVTGLFTGRSKNLTVGIVVAVFAVNLIIASGIVWKSSAALQLWTIRSNTA